jgi:hypothetical protein
MLEWKALVLDLIGVTSARPDLTGTRRSFPARLWLIDIMPRKHREQHACHPRTLFYVEVGSIIRPNIRAYRLLNYSGNIFRIPKYVASARIAGRGTLDL